MHDRPARPTAFCWNQKYPRICGEKQRTLAIQDEPQGSPPRMRGKGQAWMKEGDSERITPAYAGKSLTASSGNTGRKDHPRVCGEKFRAYAMIWQEWGSPPRMRGKELHVGILLCGIGITPAYAGKSTPTRHQKATWCGSPLHMRGKDEYRRAAGPNLGITPAYAGKSFPTSMFRSVGRDHPRICGEKIVVSRTWCSRSGLPPRMRGKVSSIRDDLARVGITPAYAGKSC